MGTLLFDERIAPFYEAWFDTPEGRRADRLEKQLLARVLELLDPPGTLLEVGCGTGHFTRWLEERGWCSTGLDCSPAMLREAQTRGGQRLLLGDALRLPFADRAFDVVALITVLEFLPHPQQALREAWRVARRGLLLGVLNRLSPIAWWRRLQGLFRPDVYRAARFYPPGELQRLVRGTAGQPVSLRWGTTLWPRWLPLEGGPLPGGAFIALAARTELGRGC
jgi:ubiquinone/menaquinone biosynthesis C-methylase UbiE